MMTHVMRDSQTLQSSSALISRLSGRGAEAVNASPSSSSVVFVVEDDRSLREALRDLLEEDGRLVEDFDNCEDFLAAYRPCREACLLLDLYLPGGMSGLDLLSRMENLGRCLSVVMMTGAADVAVAVQAMKAGALDFIQKPIRCGDLLAKVGRALELSCEHKRLYDLHTEATNKLARLTARERQIMGLVLAGHPSKNIAADLGLSQRTVEHHRASIMAKTGSRSLAALTRLTVSATR